MRLMCSQAKNVVSRRNIILLSDKTWKAVQLVLELGEVLLWVLTYFMTWEASREQVYL